MGCSHLQEVTAWVSADLKTAISPAKLSLLENSGEFLTWGRHGIQRPEAGLAEDALVHREGGCQEGVVLNQSPVEKSESSE